MNNPENDKREFFRLLLLHLNDSCSQEEFSQLCRQLKAGPDRVDSYVEFMILYSGLVQSRDARELQAFRPSERDVWSLDPALWEELSREEHDAPTVEIQHENLSTQQPLRCQKVQSPPRIYSKGNLWFSMISIAATLLLILYVWTNPRRIPQDVATVTDIYQARWKDAGMSIQKGTRLFDNRKPIELTQGVVKIHFDGGIQVVVQGPALFSLESAGQMRLTYGKLYARVSKPAIGFRVDTPSCGVIDLGTEFGVDVTDRGETNVHLFKGKASLVTASPEHTQQRQILQSHQAKCVTLAGDVNTVTFQDHAFVQDFDSEKAILWNGRNLSLAGIAAGGNGFDKMSIDMGIDQKTGNLVSGNSEQQDNTAVEGYVAVPGLPFVDGVFVPDGGQGPVRLTSAGHVFDGFADTGGDYYMTIGAYSNVNMRHGYTNIHLEGYPEDSAVNLCLHSNSGITFDLQKIRQAMPFVTITGFSSVYGIPVTREDQDDVDADFYVFVDGLPRLIKQGVTSGDEPGHIAVPLTQQDRFLTLVCTEGTLNFGDWSLFVNPVLELELAD